MQYERWWVVRINDNFKVLTRTMMPERGTAQALAMSQVVTAFSERFPNELVKSVFVDMLDHKFVDDEWLEV